MHNIYNQKNRIFQERLYSLFIEIDYLNVPRGECINILEFFCLSDFQFNHPLHVNYIQLQRRNE